MRPGRALRFECPPPPFEEAALGLRVIREAELMHRPALPGVDGPPPFPRAALSHGISVRRHRLDYGLWGWEYRGPANGDRGQDAAHQAGEEVTTQHGAQPTMGGK